jgi:hypothetical protein
MFCNSITNALNLENIDIEGRNIRYQSSTISKKIRYRSIKDRYRLSTISKKHRYRSLKLRYRYIPISKKTSISKFKTAISLYPDIEEFSISINAPSIFIYDVEAFYSISNVMFFDIGVSLPGLLYARLGTHIAVYTFGLWPTPGPPHATQPSSSLEMTDRSAPSTGRSRRSRARLPERLPLPPERASTERRST